MDTTKAFRLCRKIRKITGLAVTIGQRVWAFQSGEHQIYYRLTFFTAPDACDSVEFHKWSEIEQFAKEKWNV